MSDRSTVIYRYDGSFEGLMCCVFESYARHELPAEIITLDAPQTTLFEITEIVTDMEHAGRVLQSVPEKMGTAALEFIQRAFLTCLEQKELDILRLMRMGYRLGARVLDMLTDDVVDRLTKAVLHLEHEAHLLTGFLRFSEYNGALVAQMEPKNTVLPLMMQHFCERFPEERFLIYDRAHGMALVHEPGHAVIILLEDLELPKPGENESEIRDLWRLFYKTIEIKPRHNPRCRMGHMPKRYWKYLTEFGEPEERITERTLDSRIRITALPDGSREREQAPPLS